MDVPNLRTDTFGDKGDKMTKATPLSLEQGAQDSVSEGDNIVKEYRTKGSGFDKDNMGGLNRGL